MVTPRSSRGFYIGFFQGGEKEVTQTSELCGQRLSAAKKLIDRSAQRYLQPIMKSESSTIFRDILAAIQEAATRDVFDFLVRRLYRHVTDYHVLVQYKMADKSLRETTVKMLDSILHSIDRFTARLQAIGRRFLSYAQGLPIEAPEGQVRSLTGF